MSSHTVKAFFILIVFSKILGIFEKLAFHFAALLFCGSQISPFRPWRGFIYTYSSSFTFQSSKTRHTVAIWTFTFHNKSGFVMVIFKVKFKPAYRPVSWTFLPENSNLLYSFYLYFLQELSNPLLFGHSPMTWHIQVAIWCKNETPTFQPFRNSSNCVNFDNSCKKEKKNESNRSEFSDQKVYDTGLYAGLKFAFKITFTEPDFLWNVNVQIAMEVLE